MSRHRTVAAATALAALVLLGIHAVRIPSEASTPPRESAPVVNAASSQDAALASAPHHAGFATLGDGDVERTVVVHAAWGSAPGELGRREAMESNPEGPMSFAVDARGRAWVLDQVNARVVVFSGGRPERVIALPGDTFADLAPTEDGGLAVLDRLAGREVLFLDRDGAMAGRVPIEGDGIPEAGLVTAMFVRGDGTWLEVGHGDLVRVADDQGRPDPARTRSAGRYDDGGGRTLRASRSGAYGAVVTTVSSTGVPDVLARVEFPLPLRAITALEADRDGGIWLGASLAQEQGSAPYDVVEEAQVVVGLDAGGREQGRWELPRSTLPDEWFRRLAVGPDGALYHFSFAGDGATLWRTTP